jgi:molybdenum ABC transporter, periplasmic molybdate-binding protein
MVKRLTMKIARLVLAVLGAPSGPALADQTHVAVAANFTDAANEIAAAFRAETEHEAILSFGATGQLYTQITQDAPFEVFLSADAERPAKALAEGFGVDGSNFTYAVGRIALWSASADLVTGEETLRNGRFDKIALADPATAPYGIAAVEALTTLGLPAALEPKIVQGKNIAQTFQFIETGNAELGFVALSQIAATDRGSRWEVPADLYSPIRQDAILLKKGEANAAAAAFLDFLKGPVATAIIEKYGYGTESGN